MKHTARLLLSVLLLTLAAGGTFAATATLYYADGTSAQREVTVSVLNERDLRPSLGGATSGADVTLNTSVLMVDPANDFEEIVSAAPGQEVSFTTRFNQLGSLEVPFSDFVGRLFITGVFAPTLGVQSIIQLPIEADDDDLVGVGIGAMIPFNAPAGPFPLVGLNRITGITTAEDTAIAARLIEELSAPQGSVGNTSGVLLRALITR